MVNEGWFAAGMRGFRSLQREIANWVLPPICVLCGAAGRAYGDDLCTACDADLPVDAQPECLQGTELDAIWSAFHYEFPVADMLRQAKFHGRVAFARVLGAAAARRLPAQSIDCLLPVPLHLARLRQRGFNQALEIAMPISTTIRAPIKSNLVRRQVATREQSSLPRAGRRANVAGAFTVIGNVAGLRIGIVDDVLTTGATVHELAMVLKRAGAAQVIALTVARAGRDKDELSTPKQIIERHADKNAHSKIVIVQKSVEAGIAVAMPNQP
jgi:ComF family protein